MTAAALALLEREHREAPARPRLRIVATEIGGPAGNRIREAEAPTRRADAVQGELPLRWRADRSGTGASLRLARSVALPLQPGLPRPEPYIAHAAAVICEVVTGLRPPGQVQHWATLDVEHQLARRAAAARRDPASARGAAAPRATVLSTHPMVLGPGAVMVSVVFRDRSRARAAGLRFEARHGRWVVTEVQVGP
jgi:hypothetical protein